MNLIYTDGEYNIYEQYEARKGGRKEFIVHNTAKEFKDGHSHLKSFKTAKYLIKLCIHKSIPRHLSKYLLVSLYRLSDDAEYGTKIMELAENKADTQNYTRRYINEGVDYRQPKNRAKVVSKNGRKWGR